MHLNTNKDRNICNVLFGRLSAQGLMPVEIPRLIGDVCNIVRDGGDFTLHSINRQLMRLGWQEHIMDQICFELILYILENEYDYEVKKHTLH
jgi:hypothetical protein